MQFFWVSPIFAKEVSEHENGNEAEIGETGQKLFGEVVVFNKLDSVAATEVDQPMKSHQGCDALPAHPVFWLQEVLVVLYHFPERVRHPILFGFGNCFCIKEVNHQG